MVSRNQDRERQTARFQLVILIGQPSFHASFHAFFHTFHAYVMHFASHDPIRRPSHQVVSTRTGTRVYAKHGVHDQR